MKDTLRRITATTILVASVLTMAGCSATHSGKPAPNGPTGSGPAGAVAGFPSSQPLPTPSHGKATPPVVLPQPSTINNHDPSEVSKAVITIQWTMDTTTDNSQYQAELRSGPFLTPAYLASLKANPPVAAPGAQWDEWAAHRAYTTVATLAEHDDQPTDTATQALRQWGITVTPHGRDNWTGNPHTSTVFVTMNRVGPGSPWLVSAIHVSF